MPARNIIKSQHFHLHLVSDATGETLDAMAKAALVQFENIEAEKHLWPMIRTASQMERTMDFIIERPGLVMYTLVDADIRKVLVRRCLEHTIPTVSVLDPVIEGLAHYLGARARGLPGRQHEMDAHYFDRIDALHFTMAHDDGQAATGLAEAQIILVGVSRTSKTPTSIYLANRGFRTANVPFVPGVALPSELAGPLDALVVGLTAAPQRLVDVRTNRLRSIRELASTAYIDTDAVAAEVRDCRRLCAERGWPVIDVTRRSIEETAAAILKLYTTREEKAEHARRAGS